VAEWRDHVEDSAENPSTTPAPDDSSVLGRANEETSSSRDVRLSGSVTGTFGRKNNVSDLKLGLPSKILRITTINADVTSQGIHNISDQLDTIQLAKKVFEDKGGKQVSFGTAKSYLWCYLS
jgi:hypothetical protein